MKFLLLLLILLGAGFFCWRYLLTRNQRSLGGRWSARAAYSLAVAAALLLAVFAVSTSTTWRFF